MFQISFFVTRVENFTLSRVDGTAAIEDVIFAFSIASERGFHGFVTCAVRLKPSAVDIIIYYSTTQTTNPASEGASTSPHKHSATQDNQSKENFDVRVRSNKKLQIRTVSLVNHNPICLTYPNYLHL